MPDPQNIIPPAFWASLTEDDWQRVWANDGKLDAPLCARLYRMTDRHGTPPDEITPLINRADLDGWLDSRPGNRKARRAARARSKSK